MDSSKVKHSHAIFLLAITALLWSLGGLLIKSVNAHPMAIAGVRSTVASLVLLLVLKRPRMTWSLAQVSAAVSMAATGILFVTATKNTTAANAILLQYTAPIYVALFGAAFLKEKTRLYDWITVFVVMCGMALFFLDKLNTNGLVGNIAAVASGITFAFFAIFMRMQKDESPLESILLGSLLTAVVGLPFLYHSLPDTAGWVTLAVLGVVQNGIPYILYATAIKEATALEAVLIPVLEPLLNPLWVFFILGEVPGAWSLVGGTIVLAAVTTKCVLGALPKER